MTEQKLELRLWLIGLLAFAIVVAMGMNITGDGVEYGIIDHQAAGNAEVVDTIQAQWRDGGVRSLAIASMIGDLIFIGIYGVGSFVAGRSMMQAGSGFVRKLGLAVTVAALVFLATDYIETILQLVQLVRDAGSDWMAGTAATVRPVKVAAWLVTFFGVIGGIVVHRISRPSA